MMLEINILLIGFILGMLFIIMFFIKRKKV